MYQPLLGSNRFFWCQCLIQKKTRWLLDVVGGFCAAGRISHRFPSYPIQGSMNTKRHCLAIWSNMPHRNDQSLDILLLNMFLFDIFTTCNYFCTHACTLYTCKSTALRMNLGSYSHAFKCSSICLSLKFKIIMFSTHVFSPYACHFFQYLVLSFFIYSFFPRCV